MLSGRLSVTNIRLLTTGRIGQSPIHFIDSAKDSSGNSIGKGPFDFTSDALSEVSSFFRKSGRVIVPLTVREILDDQIAQKLV